MNPILKPGLSKAILILLLLHGSLLRADGQTRDTFGEGKRYGAFQLGYADGFSFGFMGQGDGRNVEYLALLPSFGIGISDALAGDSWYRGNFDLVLEGEFITGLKPSGGYSVGAAFLLRYNFLGGERFIPYLEGGAGVGYLEFDLVDQSDGLVFYPQIGVGVHYLVSDRIAVNAGWRIHHMSNAGTEFPNNSINAHLFLVGLSYLFD